MTREPHESVATVLVDPCVLGDLELALITLDLRVWPEATAPLCLDGPRTAFQIHRRLVMERRGSWDMAAGSTPVWIGFGSTWYDGDEPLPWAAHAALWRGREPFAAHVRYRRRLGGIGRVALPEGLRR